MNVLVVEAADATHIVVSPEAERVATRGVSSWILSDTETALTICQRPVVRVSHNPLYANPREELADYWVTFLKKMCPDCMFAAGQMHGQGQIP